MNELGRVAVLLGGRSHERGISLRSGRAVCDALIQSGISATCLDTSNGFLKELKNQPPDIAFLALHGKGGEDGAIQTVLERLKIPYVGSSPKSSRLAFDKHLSKKMFDTKSIPTPTWHVVTRSNWRLNWNRITAPVFLKPTCDGSSIGVVLVMRQNQLKRQVQKSVAEYGKILIEKRIVGREFTVGILGKQALPVVELKPKRRFYDYKAKYTRGMTQYLVPAPIPSTFAKRLQFLALKTHRVLGLRDFSRIDFMVDQDNHPYVLEANSIPGFTELSLLPKAAEASGIAFSELCTRILYMAKKRG